MRRATRAAAIGLAVALSTPLLFSASNTGKLKVATPGMVLKLKIRGTDYKIPPNKVVPLPVGTYKASGLQVYAQEPRSRDLWRLNGRSYGKLAQIEVKPGELTTVEGGQPIKVRTPVSLSKKGSQTIALIGLGYSGTSGEYYSTVVYKGRSRVPHPKLVIVAENGRVIHKAQFEYG